MRIIPLVLAVLTLFSLPVCRAADEVEHDLIDDRVKLTPLFNGKDFTGWVPVNVAPNTFTVKDGVIHSTGVPTGIMRTERQYENFIIELDWMHEKPAGNAGLFVWGAPMTAPGTPFAKGIEVQILDDAYVTGQARAEHWYTGQGDIFSIHGASMKPDRPHPKGWERCLPSEDRTNPAGQWNHYRVEARDGRITLAVNGKVVSGGSNCRPRKGYLCLESEGSPAQFKNIRIAELPSTNPKPSECQPEAEDFKSIYTGVDLANWKPADGQKAHWKPDDWKLAYDGKGDASDKTLWTEKEYGDFVLIADWRFTKDIKQSPNAEDQRGGIALGGDPKAVIELGASPLSKLPGQWNRMVITVRGGDAKVVLNDETLFGTAPLAKKLPARGAIGLVEGSSPVEFANLFIRELK